MTGSELIIAERQRQIDVEGWTLEHDDGHVNGELSAAAISYVDEAFILVTEPEDPYIEGTIPFGWPSSWDEEWWKPSDDPIRNLVKAGALIAAEIDRLQRAKEKE